MLIKFKGFRAKWYAATPMGELAFGESQGLYEWRGGQRIHYTGGDRQISDRDGMWDSSGGLSLALVRGFQAAVLPYRLPTS